MKKLAAIGALGLIGVRVCLLRGLNPAGQTKGRLGRD